jgi:hypothetical protein
MPDDVSAANDARQYPVSLNRHFFYFLLSQNSGNIFNFLVPDNCNDLSCGNVQNVQIQQFTGSCLKFLIVAFKNRRKVQRINNHIFLFGSPLMRCSINFSMTAAPCRSP